MALAVGTLEYTLGSVPVTGCGLSWSPEECDAALVGPIAEVVFDNVGNVDIEKLLGGLSDTEFSQDAIRRVLEASRPPENWRVGEALAETYLVHHKNCHFPWSSIRDERKSGSSLPGADLVGFQQYGETCCFAFGEVKTSGESSYPPGVVYGRAGLEQQLENLRDAVSIRDGLVKYLLYRATNAPWKKQCIDATKRYLADHADIRIFGVLIRDVSPHQDDLRNRIINLGNGCPSAMVIELIAIYLPVGTIATLSEKVINSRRGSGE